MYKYLHSTMYLLNLSCETFISTNLDNLHSTMYLLNRSSANKYKNTYPHLHSTMYLLNPEREAIKEYNRMIYIPLCIY